MASAENDPSGSPGSAAAAWRIARVEACPTAPRLTSGALRPTAASWLAPGLVGAVILGAIWWLSGGSTPPPAGALVVPPLFVVIIYVAVVQRFVRVVHSLPVEHVAIGAPTIPGGGVVSVPAVAAYRLHSGRRAHVYLSAAVAGQLAASGSRHRVIVALVSARSGRIHGVIGVAGSAATAVIDRSLRSGLHLVAGGADSAPASADAPRMALLRRVVALRRLAAGAGTEAEAAAARTKVAELMAAHGLTSAEVDAWDPR